jgi:hypothetical protein
MRIASPPNDIRVQRRGALSRGHKGQAARSRAIARAAGASACPRRPRACGRSGPFEEQTADVPTVTSQPAEGAGTYGCLNMSTEISTAVVVPSFSIQCVVAASSRQPGPGPYSVASPSR